MAYTSRSRLIRVLITGVVLVLCFVWAGCGKASHSENGNTSGAAASENPAVSDTKPEETDELGDGSYNCTVTNTDRGNGPYTLTCDKNGDDVVRSEEHTSELQS